jgi:Ribonuclease H2 non-catalytic subunit (Ylr154p-like)
MPFHIEHTGPAPVSMFLRVEKMKPDEEIKGAVVDVEMKSDLLAPPLQQDQDQDQPTAVKDLDRRFISSFRGRTIHGLTVDVPTGYTGLLLHGDPQPTVTHAGRVSDAEVKSGLEEEEVDSSTKGGRNTRSKSKGVVGTGKGKGKAKEKEGTTIKAVPKGRLARTAAPKQPEVITVDNEDEEMADPALAEPPTEVLDDLLGPTNDNTNAPPDNSIDNDFEMDKEIPLRKLIPQSTFSSITLWHADRAVDETRDEYYRTLSEWMALSHEVSIRVMIVWNLCSNERNIIDSSNGLVTV